MKIAERIKAPTPTFFKKVRNTGLTLAAISAAIMGAPMALPAIVVKIASYLAVTGGTMSAISQATVKREK
jgi:hypothetical protein